MQALLEEVDQHKLTIQQLQEQLQALTALKQQTSTVAQQPPAQQSGQDATDASPGASQGGNTPTEVADGDAAKPGREVGEVKNKPAAIIVGDQVGAWLDYAIAEHFEMLCVMNRSGKTAVMLQRLLLRVGL